MSKSLTYRKIDNGDFGTFVECQSKYNQHLPTAEELIGTTVTVSTRGGDRHQRVIGRIVTRYASGVLVAFAPDAEIAANAAARYQAKAGGHVRAHAPGDRLPCPKCGTYCCGDCSAH